MTMKKSLKTCYSDIVSNQKGFTLIELMVVIGILVLLLAITLIAINPSRQFGLAQDTKRHSDIVQISNAIYQNIAEHAGVFTVGSSPFTIPLTPAPISNTGADICAGIIPNYMPALPQDPSSNSGADIISCASYNTGYVISRDATNRISVYAPSANPPITVTR
jgi:prepilin-type N-terminal cleavage/methylation domain-containing protein